MADVGQKFDDVLRNLAGQAGSLEALLRVFFSFLHRNTDFYVTYDPSTTSKASMGFPPGKAEQLLLRAFRSFPYKPCSAQRPAVESGTATAPPSAVHSSKKDASFSTGAATSSGRRGPSAARLSPSSNAMPTHRAGNGSTAAEPSKSRSATARPPPPPPQKDSMAREAPGDSNKKPSDPSLATTSSNAVGTSSSMTTTATTASTPPATAAGAPAPAAESSDPPPRASISVRYTEDGKQVPIGNGGVTPKYYWTQTVNEATVYVDVPAGTRARDVSCVIQPRRLNLRVRRAGAGNGSGSGGGGGDDADVVIDGELPSAVSRENSMWSLDDGKTVVISFEKTTRSWWKNVVEGDPEIDTTKVDSTTRISEYDDETQGTIRKLMFDQRQKALGLPTSDQLSADSILEKAKGLPGSPFLPGGTWFEGGKGGPDDLGGPTS